MELRADLLDPREREKSPEFPRRLATVLGCSSPTIFTVRRAEDGGRFDGNEESRIALLLHAARHGAFAYLDIEIDLSDTEDGKRVARAAADGGAGVIRSLHDFSGVPDDLVRTMNGASRREDDVVKCAVTPRGMADLVRLFRMSRQFDVPRAIVIGMGPYGTVTRVLPAKFGSILTFVSCPGEQAAPGHLTPQVLTEVFQRPSVTEDTPVFAVIGAPIGHSKSPLYHNARFVAEEVHAVYVPILVDEVQALFELAEELPILGFSVTIPHKEAVMEYVDELEPEAVAARSCNTVLSRHGGGWIGTNTDITGFLSPTQEAFGRPLRGAKALVIGAGGTSRGVVYALLTSGAEVVIANRTMERAQQLASDLSSNLGSKPASKPAAVGRVTVASFDEAAGGAYDLVAQTTSVGMGGDVDAAEWYEFRGTETVFDAVYTPPDTPFIQRARSAGCRVVTGDRMFDAQADAQFRFYRALAMEAADV